MTPKQSDLAIKAAYIGLAAAAIQLIKTIIESVA